MKITELVYKTVVAFEPRKRPYCALFALSLFLLAFVAVVFATGGGALKLIGQMV